MSAIPSLRWLPEPAYIHLAGADLPSDLAGYFTRLRPRTSALAELERRKEPADLLQQMVDAGGLLALPAMDEQATRVLLRDLTIQTPQTYQTPACVPHALALMRIPDRPGRVVAVSTSTAEILTGARTSTLGAAIYAAAARRHVAPLALWPWVLHDLTGVLLEGVATLIRPNIPALPIATQESS